MVRKILVFLVIFYAPGCMQTFNSNTGDEGLLGNCVDTSNTNLRAAYTVIKDNCINCHSGYHNSWSTNCTDQAWIDSGTVTAGDIDNSSLIFRMKNYSPPGNMPIGAPAIPNDEYETLKTWIQGI